MFEIGDCGLLKRFDAQQDDRSSGNGGVLRLRVEPDIFLKVAALEKQSVAPDRMDEKFI